MGRMVGSQAVFVAPYSMIAANFISAPIDVLWRGPSLVETF